MAKAGMRDSGEWTKIDVKKEIRDKLQSYRYLHKYRNVNDMISEWLELANKTEVNKDLKGKKER
jgi:hypothetical protein